MRQRLSKEERREKKEEKKIGQKERKQKQKIRKALLKGPRRERRREALRNGKEKARRALPSGFTLANAFLGFFALLAVTSGEIVRAAVFILAAALMDMLDGTIARQMGLASDFGLQLDSLADTLSFAVVPATIIYFIFFNSTVGAVIGAVAILCGILRLARFNLQVSKSHYIGISTPLFTVMVVTFSLAKELSPDSVWATLPQPAYAAIFLLLALTMISPLRFPAFKGTMSKYKMRLFSGMLLLGFAFFHSGVSIRQVALLFYVIVFALFLIPLLFEPIVKKRAVVIFSSLFLISAALIYHLTNDTTTLLIFPVYYMILGLPSLTPCFE